MLRILTKRIYGPLVTLINVKTVYGTASVWGIGRSSTLTALVLSPAFFFFFFSFLFYQTQLNYNSVCLFI